MLSADADADNYADAILLGQHWAELMAKEMPESEAYGPSKVKIVKTMMTLHL